MQGFPDFTNYNKINVSNITETHGVYLLAFGLKNLNTVRVFYVGSGNIKERLLAHLLSSEPNKCIVNNLKQYVCYYSFKQVLGGEEARKREEQKVLDYFLSKGLAKCNKTTEV